MKKRDTLYLIDGSAIAYRSYFGTIKSRLTTSDGQPTGASYAFINSMLKLLNEKKPVYVAMVFDAPEKTFRHEIYPEYKATRESMPEDLVAQLPHIHKLTEAMNMSILITPGYEADDVLGTLAKQGKEQGLEVYMVTADKDLMQIIEDNIYIYKPGSGKKESEVINRDGVIEKFGVHPEQIPDYLGLIGDSSDNIPGIKGIGPAKAKPLLQEYSSIEGIYKNIGKISNPRVAKLLTDGREDAEFSKKLTTINIEVPLDEGINDLKFDGVNTEELRTLCEELEFHSLIKIHKLEKQESPQKEYRTVRTLKEIRKLVKEMSKAPLLSVDLETSSVRPMEAEIVGISFSWKPHTGVYIPIQFPSKQQSLFDEGDNLNFLMEFKPILEDVSIPKCGQNLKYDILILRRYGIEMRNIYFDTILAAFLIQPDTRSYKLDNLSQQYLHYRMQPIEELIGKGKNQKQMDQVAVEKVSFYAAEDADIALELVPVLQQELEKEKLEGVYRNIEMELLPVLLQMEQNGVFLNAAYLKQMSEKLGKQIDTLSGDIFFEAGMEFNINSPKQLGQILFDKLELPTGKKHSTAEKVLQKLTDHHPLPGMVLEYRKLTKLKNTYLDALPKLINKKTGRVHSSFNQTVAATGRLSSSHPNFQNIPIRTEIGREIRKAFIPQKEGWKILAADYSQIELRIMAHVSGDDELVKAFQDGVDIHTRTAALVNNVDEKEVTQDMRRAAKLVNFGIMYGAGPFRLSNELKISMNEARDLIDQYFDTYPGINNYIIQTLENARDKNYVRTIAGRLRYTYNIGSSNGNLQKAAERAAINMPIQGTAADMIKIAMINIHKRLIEENWQTMMILQVHDELIFEVPEDEVEKLRKMVVNEMEKALILNVPVKVDVDFGNSWYEAH